MFQRVPEHAAVLHHFSHAYEGDAHYVTKLRSWLRIGSPLVWREWHALHPRIHGQALSDFGNILERPKNRWHLNWFRRQGTLRYECLSDPRDITSRLTEFMDLHITAWRAKGQPSLFQDPENRRFYDYMLEELATYQAIRFDVLSLNGKMIAAHFGFNWGGSVCFYKECYDPAFSKHGPGNMLRAHIIRSAIAGGADEVDFLCGREEYKDHYASDIRTTGSLSIHRSRFDVLSTRLLGRLGLDDLPGRRPQRA